MNNVIISTDNEIEADKEVSDIILNYLTALGDWLVCEGGGLGEPEWGTPSENAEYRMYVHQSERDALIANQELLGINVKLESKEVN